MNEIEAICSEIVQSISETEISIQWRKLARVSEILHAVDLRAEHLLPIFDLERKVFETATKNRHFLEERILLLLTFISRNEFEETPPNNCFLELNQDLAQRMKEGKQKNKYHLALALKEFAFEIMSFKRSRDSFASKRRGIAFEIMEPLSYCYETSDILSFVLKELLAKKSYLEILPMIQFLECYHYARALAPDSLILDTLNQLIDQTKDKTIAVTALDFMVKIGEISELSALFRIESWEEQ